MAEITITLPSPLNQSVQAGDIAYYVDIDSNSVGGFSVNEGGNLPTKIGIIKVITVGTSSSTLLCNIDDSTPLPTTNSFILFEKNRAINEASIIGYYGEFKFINDSIEKAELFSAACELVESSK
jgi:hypothetical protein